MKIREHLFQGMRCCSNHNCVVTGPKEGMECGYMDLHNLIYDGKDLEAMRKVTRFEVIDEEGRTYTNHLEGHQKVAFSLQDDDKTLKVFIQ